MPVKDSSVPFNLRLREVDKADMLQPRIAEHNSWETKLSRSPPGRLFDAFRDRENEVHVVLFLCCSRID